MTFKSVFDLTVERKKRSNPPRGYTHRGENAPPTPRGYAGGVAPKERCECATGSCSAVRSSPQISNTVSPVDNEIEFKCRIYQNGPVVADPEIHRKSADFSEREIASGTGLHGKPICKFCHGGTVTHKIYERLRGSCDLVD